MYKHPHRQLPGLRGCERDQENPHKLYQNEAVGFWQGTKINCYSFNCFLSYWYNVLLISPPELPWVSFLSTNNNIVHPKEIYSKLINYPDSVLSTRIQTQWKKKWHKFNLSYKGWRCIQQFNVYVKREKNVVPVKFIKISFNEYV